MKSLTQQINDMLRLVRSQYTATFHKNMLDHYYYKKFNIFLEIMEACLRKERSYKIGACGNKLSRRFNSLKDTTT